LEIFNDPVIGEEVLKLKPLFITALGHVANDTFLDKIADRKFHLPHDYGNKLKTWVDEASEEMTKSKSALIDQVKKDFTKTFEEALKTKDQAIKNLNEEKDKLFERLNTATSKNSKTVIWVIIALIAGILAGVLISNLM
jgi:exonuclease VII large subunit